MKRLMIALFLVGGLQAGVVTHEIKDVTHATVHEAKDVYHGAHYVVGGIAHAVKWTFKGIF